jgi:hypothetical protein
MIFVYGRHSGSNLLCERSLSFLEEIPPEGNMVVREWKAAGIEAESSFITQALLQLTGDYCKKRRCLECRIGSKLISIGQNQGETIA